MSFLANDTYLNNITQSPTSNDYYIKQIVTTEFKNNDNSTYPYKYQVIKCDFCNKESQYYRKLWFGFLSFDNITYECNKCPNKNTSDV